MTTFVGLAHSGDLSAPSGTSRTVARPSGVASGDLLLAHVLSRRSSLSQTAHGLTPPAGWTLLRAERRADSSFNQFTTVWTKVAGDEEPASYSWTQPENGRMAAAVLAYRNAVVAGDAGDSGGSTGANQRHAPLAATVADLANARALTFAGCVYAGTDSLSQHWRIGGITVDGLYVTSDAWSSRMVAFDDAVADQSAGAATPPLYTHGYTSSNSHVWATVVVYLTAASIPPPDPGDEGAWSYAPGDGTEVALTFEGRAVGGSVTVGSLVHVEALEAAPSPVAGRYVDAATLQAINDHIDADGDISTFVPAQEVLELYGLTINRIGGGATLLAGYTSESVTTGTSNYRRALRLIFDELAKYPPPLILGRLSRITLTQNLVNTSNPSFDMGGLAYSGTCWLDVEGLPSRSAGTFWDDSTDGVALTAHHELQHVLKNFNLSDFTAMRPMWEALNPDPYIGDAVHGLPYAVRPPGHFRYYGRKSYWEDLADVQGFLFTTSLQPLVASITAEDATVTAKVAMLKDWYASKVPVMGDPAYWAAIHA